MKVAEARLIVNQPAPKESVDGWPLAIIIQKTFEGHPKLVAVPFGDVTGGWYPSIEGCMVQRGPASGSRIPTAAADHPLSNPVGAIGWLVDVSRRLRPREAARAGCRDFSRTPTF